MPGDAITLTLTRDAAGRKLRFAFQANGSLASEGLVG
jgi:hypothetical protein